MKKIGRRDLFFKSLPIWVSLVAGGAMLWMRKYRKNSLPRKMDAADALRDFESAPTVESFKRFVDLSIQFLDSIKSQHTDMLRNYRVHLDRRLEIVPTTGSLYEALFSKVLSATDGHINILLNPTSVDTFIQELQKADHKNGITFLVSALVGEAAGVAVLESDKSLLSDIPQLTSKMLHIRAQLVAGARSTQVDAALVSEKVALGMALEEFEMIQRLAVIQYLIDSKQVDWQKMRSALYASTGKYISITWPPFAENVPIASNRKLLFEQEFMELSQNYLRQLAIKRQNIWTDTYLLYLVIQSTRFQDTGGAAGLNLQGGFTMLELLRMPTDEASKSDLRRMAGELAPSVETHITRWQKLLEPKH